MNMLRLHGRFTGSNEPVYTYIVLLVVLSGILLSCDHPTQSHPDQSTIDQLTPGASPSPASIYHINRQQQTCNPSVAPRGPYNGCILFLGYDLISVTVPDEFSAYTNAPVSSHDRLSIVDTANTLRWYALYRDIDSSGRFQCPEWSTADNYIVTLFGTISHEHSVYAIRLSDHEFLPLGKNLLDEFSYPHLHIGSADTGAAAPETLSYYPNGWLERTKVHRFFGTYDIVAAYTNPSESGQIFYISYRDTGNVQPKPLKKPQGREEWHCSSPLVSPDGAWVTYHCFSNPAAGNRYSSYIQRLEPDASPILIADGASDPHWWVNPETGQYHIIYSVTIGHYFSGYDYTDTLVQQEHSAGYTLKKPLVDNGAYQQLEPDTLRAPDTLLYLPFKGGISIDGQFLATAFKYAYIAYIDEEK